MGKIEYMEQLKLKNYSWAGPKYYDYPDGEDLFGKLSFVLRVVGPIGISVSAVSAAVVPPIPPTFLGKMVRTGQLFAPVFTTAVVFTTVTYFSTRLRKKDDAFNYAIGGFISGLSLAATTNKPVFAISGAIGLAILGYCKKTYKMQGMDLIPNVHKKHLSSYLLRNLDTSLIQERKGNWTRDPAPK